MDKYFIGETEQEISQLLVIPQIPTTIGNRSNQTQQLETQSRSPCAWRVTAPWAITVSFLGRGSQEWEPSKWHASVCLVLFILDTGVLTGLSASGLAPTLIHLCMFHVFKTRKKRKLTLWCAFDWKFSHITFFFTSEFFPSLQDYQKILSWNVKIKKFWFASFRIFTIYSVSEFKCLTFRN